VPDKIPDWWEGLAKELQFDIESEYDKNQIPKLSKK
jgi:hypothetical protein